MIAHGTQIEVITKENDNWEEVFQRINKDLQSIIKLKEN